jgi:two-component system response regulator AtoC
MRFKKQRILIVDDNNDIRDILSEFLLIQGFEAECADNGMEALSLFFKYHFDAVLTDFQMPCMDGLTLAHEIRKKEPKTLIIMMTSDIWMSIQKKDFVDYVVEKPFRLNEIYNMLQSALRIKRSRLYVTN